ncbi:MAG: sensor histidine kinase [Actinomycetota bacterium]
MGVRDDVARIIAATPSLRSSWLLAAIAIALFATWSSSVDPHLVTAIAVLAPILPVLGVATAYGPWADPMFEMTQTTPASGFRVLLLRSIAVLLSAVVLVGIATAVVPETEIVAIAWVLPSLALCSASLMLATFMPLHRAAFLVAFIWLLVAAVVATTQPATALFRGPAQLVFCGVTIASSMTLARRRQHLEIANLHARSALVDAADAERRRIERNIHDGAQQQLVAIGVKAGLARALVARDPEKAITILDQVSADAEAALATLREMTRGACPPILADEGLAAALSAKAKTAPVPVTVAVEDLGNLSRAVEIAAYFCCAEALQNTVKYARASSVAIRVGLRAGKLSCRVIDDGVGFDPSTVRRGVGMRSMADRVEGLGGALDVHSAPGSGTTITATIPVRTD